MNGGGENAISISTAIYEGGNGLGSNGKEGKRGRIPLRGSVVDEVMIIG